MRGARCCVQTQQVTTMAALAARSMLAAARVRAVAGVARPPAAAAAAAAGLLLPSLRLVDAAAAGLRFQSSKKKAAAAASAAAASAPAAPKKPEARAGLSRAMEETTSKYPKKAGSGPATSRAGGGVDGDIIMSIKHLGKTLPGGRALFQNVSLAFQRGAKIGVLGLNGSGKSSLLKIIGGVDSEFDGEVWRHPDMRVGYLEQEPALDPTRNVHHNIMDGLAEKTGLLARYDELSHAMGDPDADIDALLAEQATVQAAIDRHDCWNLNHVVETAKSALRVPPDDADVTKLSGGERRRVALCRLLLEQPDILLLDEPTNHLDADSVAWLEAFLREYKGTVLAITHDRYFLDNVAGWILEIDRGTAYPYQGNYSVWLEKKQARLDLEKKQERKRAKAMEEELEWIRKGPSGRHTKSKARVTAYERMVEEAESTRSRDRFMSGAIVIPPAPRLGDVVVRARGVSKAFDGRALIKDASFDIPKGGIVGIIGGNGTGKSTLLKMITGDLPLDEGTITVGPTVKIGMVSQTRSELTDNQRVIDVVSGGSDTVLMGGDYEMPIQQYLASFNLMGEQQSKLVRSLSGGERNRVHLARVLKTGANLLMLDEPTNDLDVDTLRSLEEALETYTGCALIVSHDRFFLDRVATHMMAFHGDGRVEYFEGGYSEYEAHAARQGKSLDKLLKAK